jgi:glycosyltransferase involved in cell wall biosynthesis
VKKLSCIIPIYNLASVDNYYRFSILCKKLISALSCLSLDSYEIIIVNDDVENDMTLVNKLIADELCFKGSYFILNNGKNFGQAYSRNIGAKYAKGKYLYFIDQDDFISKGFFSEWLKYESADIADLYIANVSFYFDCDGHTKHALTPVSASLYYHARKISRLWFMLCSNIAYSPGQVIFRKELFYRANGFVELRNRGADDFGLFYNICFYCSAKVCYMPKAMFYYRIHESQSSNSLNMDASVYEFFISTKIDSFRKRIIYSIKTKKIWKTIGKIAYIILFRRASRR